MNSRDAVRAALRALLTHKGRTVLTSLGILVGISSVIALASAGYGAQRELDDRLAKVGKNLILIRPGAHTNSGAVTDDEPLTTADADAVRREVGPLLDGLAPEQILQRRVSTGTRNWVTVIAGATPDLRVVRDWQLARGRFLGDEDLKHAAPVCVLGDTVRHKLFPDTPDPVGRLVRLDRLQLRVVGVLAPKGRNPAGADQDDEILIPLTALQQKLAGEERITIMLASARSADRIDRAKGQIIAVLRERRRLRPDQPNDFDVSSVRELSEIAGVLAGTLQSLVAVLAALSLVVGGIGIMNIMLVSVTERTREIGIRRALGARAADILAQFLCEALALALIGGLLGITLGIAGALAVSRLTGWPVHVSPAVVTLAFLVAAGVGVFFGFYPAWRASRLDPIEALRYE